MATAPLVHTRPRRIGDALRRIRRRLREDSLGAYILGLWVRRHFQRAGIVVVPGGGFPIPTVQNHGYIEIENCALFPGVRLECWAGGTLRIGNGTYLNRNVEIVTRIAVDIGQDCKIARDVIIMDTDQHPLPSGKLAAEPVTIEDRVWIGARAIVLKGVSIGHDAVIPGLAAS